MNYIHETLNNQNTDVNFKLYNQAVKNAAEAQKEIDRLNDLIQKSNEKIQRWQNAKITSNKAQKAYYNQLIKQEKEVLITNKFLLTDEKEKQKEYKNTAKSLVEAEEIINQCYKDRQKELEYTKECVESAYKIWFQNNEDTASSSKILNEESKMLNESLKIQGMLVNDTKIAYDEMVAKYGESYTGSQKLYASLLDEVYAYNKIADSMEKVNNSKIYAQRESIFALNDYLEKYKEPLKESGFKEEEIYEIARNVSGYTPINSENSAKIPVKISLDDNSFDDIEEQINTTFIPDLQNIEAFKTVGSDFANDLKDGFISTFSLAAKSIILMAENTAKETYEAMKNAISNTTVNYNFSASEQTIYEQIEDTKRAEELSKARGLNET